MIKRILGLSLLLLASVCQAQSWPSKPIKMVVNFAPGSAPDVLARTAARGLSDAVRQPVVVENRAGAAGNVGAEYVLNAAPDGYTVLYSPGSTITMNPHLYKFNGAKDLIPVAALTDSVLPLVVRADLPIHSVNDLIQYGKANPGKLTYGSSGSGSPLHVAVEILLHAAQVKAVHIPYKGSAQTTNALLAKEVDFAFDAGVAAPHVKAGKLRYLALGSSRRSRAYPGLPTVQEQSGIELDVGVPSGVFVPPGTPAEIIDVLNREFAKIVKDEKFVAGIATLNSVPPQEYMSPKQLEQLYRSYSDKFGSIIRAAQIKAD